jgi:hypothetical protein
VKAKFHIAILTFQGFNELDSIIALGNLPVSSQSAERQTAVT